jgi:hypothetical protein
MTAKTPPGRGGGGRYTRTDSTRRRDYHAAELHGQGWSYQRIADELGFASKGAACNAVTRAYADMATEKAGAARQADLERLDRLIEQAWQVMLTPHLAHANGRVVRRFVGVERDADGIERLDPLTGKTIPVFEDVFDDGPKLAAIATIRSLLERRARIFGYDAPAKSRVEVITADMIESRITELESQLADNDPADTGAG